MHRDINMRVGQLAKVQARIIYAGGVSEHRYKHYLKEKFLVHHKFTNYSWCPINSNVIFALFACFPAGSKSNLDSDNTECIENLKRQHKAKVDSLTKQYESRLSTMSSDTALEKLKKQHETLVKSLSKQHESSLSAMATDMNELKEKLGAAKLKFDEARTECRMSASK